MSHEVRPRIGTDFDPRADEALSRSLRRRIETEVQTHDQVAQWRLDAELAMAALCAELVRHGCTVKFIFGLPKPIRDSPFVLMYRDTHNWEPAEWFKEHNERMTYSEEVEEGDLDRLVQARVDQSRTIVAYHTDNIPIERISTKHPATGRWSAWQTQAPAR